MKIYKDFEKKDIGVSDIALLIMVGYRKNEGLITEPLRFGGDGCYYAYIINQTEDEDVKIDCHYTKVATFNNWLKIYDDSRLTYEVDAKEINIYRAGDYGCIIQIINSL